jgi:glycosyltransferase involved in cell wall biosynthesis
MHPPVSVIIPTHNRCRLLPATIDSVLAQDYFPFELIVVDDGSTDATSELLRGYGARLRVVRQANRGAAAARNSGIAAARHDLLAFLDSDDQFAPGKLARQAGVMAQAPEYLISHTDEIWFHQGQLLKQKKKHARTGGDLFARSLKLCVVGMSTVMVRRRFFDEVGHFDERLPCCEDYDLWLRAARRLEFLHLPEPLTIKQGGRADQLSRFHRLGMDRYRIFALVKLLHDGELRSGQETVARRELAKKCRIYGRGCLKHGRREEGEFYLKIAEEQPPP